MNLGGQQYSVHSNHRVRMLLLGGKKLREASVRNKVNEDEGWEITESDILLLWPLLSCELQR